MRRHTQYIININGATNLDITKTRTHCIKTLYANSGKLTPLVSIHLPSYSYSHNAFISHTGIVHRSRRTVSGIMKNTMRPEKLNELFLKYLTPTSRLEFIVERIQDISEMLEEVNYEICCNGVEAED